MDSKRNALVAFATIIFLTASMGLFAGGDGEESGEDEPITLEYWDFRTDDERDFMETFHHRFVENEREIIVEYTQFPLSDYITKLTTAFSAGTGPDFFQVSPGEFLRFVNSGIAMDLTPYFTDEMLEDFTDTSIDAVTVNDKIYGVPYETDLLGLYYNEDMLSEANVEPPETWEEFVAATEELTTDDTWGATIEPEKGYYGNFVWYPYLWHGGGEVLDRNTGEATFDSEAAQQALQLWRDLLDAGAPRSLPDGTWEAGFIGQGQTAMQFTGTWIIPILENEYPDMNLKVVPLPIPEGGQTVTAAGGWNFMVNSNSEHAEVAAELVTWSFGQNVDIPTEWATEAKFAYPPRRSVVENAEEIYTEGLRSVFTEQIYDSAIPEPRYPADIVDTVGSAIQNALFSDQSMDAITSEANQEIQDFLDDYNGEL